ncbi:MAG: hypothetical protein WCP69_07050 [Bacteroidota bacterium]
MKKISNQNKGIIGTALFHALLLLCFLFMGFKTPLPLPPEEGIEIDMGGGGGGSSDPVNVKPTPSSEDEYVTQDNEASSAISNSKVKKTKTETKVDPVVDPRLIYKKGSNTNGTGTGVGPGNGSGIGPGSGGGTGGGTDGGIGPNKGPGFSLNGRSAKSLPAPEINNVQGKVVVRIKVDPSGKVVDAEAVSKGSTIANAKVWKKCEDFAMKAKFSAKPDAPEVQMGTITYIIE